jgi:LPS export ABC transporter protein LptC/lipopolysaccharide transport protein LptA
MSKKMRLRIPKLNKYTLLFALLVVFIFLEILFISPKVLEKPPDDVSPYQQLQAMAQSKKRDAVEQKMLGVHLVENDENKKGWELFASEASGTSDSQWVLKKVKVEFFSNDNSSFTVMGEVGEIDGASRDMVIRGDVLTTSTNGYQFKTDSLRYSAKDKIMRSSDAVFMEGPPDKKGAGFKLNGVGLEVDLKNNKMTILDHVEAEKKMDEKNFHLTSTRAEFSNKNQEALFSGHVKMNLGESHIEAPLAQFYYSNSQKSLEKIVLKGGVNLTEKDKKATCRELEIDLAENKMTLRGQPKVQQGEDQIQGEEIVFLDGGKKVKINRVTLTGQEKK